MSHSHNTRERKKAEFAHAAPPRSKKTTVLATMLGVLVLIVVFLAFGPSQASGAFTPVVPDASGNIRVSLAELSSGEARFFQYTAAGDRPVQFFVMRSSDGLYRAALNACDVCYRGKQGYFQQGDDMVCKKCGRHFPSPYINEVSGGCNPVGLARSIDGSSLVIPAAQLEAGAAFF